MLKTLIFSINQPKNVVLPMLSKVVGCEENEVGVMNSLSVKKGDKINRGQKLGGVGDTGRSTAAHLHYEVKRYGKTVNPGAYYTYNKQLKNLVYYR